MTGLRELKTLTPFSIDALAYFVSKPPTSNFFVVISLKKKSNEKTIDKFNCPSPPISRKISLQYTYNYRIVVTKVKKQI